MSLNTADERAEVDREIESRPRVKTVGGDADDDDDDEEMGDAEWEDQQRRKAALPALTSSAPSTRLAISDAPAMEVYKFGALCLLRPPRFSLRVHA